MFCVVFWQAAIRRPERIALFTKASPALVNGAVVWLVAFVNWRLPRVVPHFVTCSEVPYSASDCKSLDELDAWHKRLAPRDPGGGREVA